MITFFEQSATFWMQGPMAFTHKSRTNRREGLMVLNDENKI
jgi:hypothetical protein